MRPIYPSASNTWMRWLIIKIARFGYMRNRRVFVQREVHVLFKKLMRFCKILVFGVPAFILLPDDWKETLEKMKTCKFEHDFGLPSCPGLLAQKPALTLLNQGLLKKCLKQGADQDKYDLESTRETCEFLAR
ncbi:MULTISPECIES: hypothetical protein [Rhizobium/Agrobacterium group]|uniref:Uncharacterized protein n=1 Tax=Agrobacterium vitis TaxID=373 RepID=A0ABD6HC52_AGRVI|nr:MULTISPECIES: hypothetical protein [Rhizobium/Agrobacterium group]MCF1448321.1 hypothetical protein [Allorhizobium ampelinum]MCF1492004.1 hypothetical protein [Allorhizobium ampelinum]MUO30330.1 hypothetical protein [Agrobacterium vitis]MUO44632.1 hypothetical protein [Agrobacterium vitis]MUP12219.1 hypothetical protein [Agrobacterium vitis]